MQTKFNINKRTAKQTTLSTIWQSLKIVNQTEKRGRVNTLLIHI